MTRLKQSEEQPFEVLATRRWFNSRCKKAPVLAQISAQINSPGWWTETSMEILKARYARGEIDEEEFERRRRDLES